ncbi:MAG TPA: anti-sigma factor [Gemmatimonadaceae bacterium]|nr:anti-sigma factor [Gemmatimonadaceae bacterium]
MSHEEAYSELAAIALGAASTEVSAAVREHAAACPECGPELVAMEEAVAQLGQLVPSAVVNRGRAAGIRSRLVMRARGERETRSSAAPRARPDLARGVASLTGLGHKLTPESQRAVEAEIRKVAPQEKRRTFVSGPVLLALAASIAFVVVAVQLGRVMAERDALRAEVASGADTANAPGTTGGRRAENEALVAAMASPDVKIVPLASGNATRMGRMFWNPSSNDWTFVVYTMPPPKPGMTYQIWLVTDSTKISAGTFNPDQRGHAFMQAKYALDRDALKAVAVTEEPAGGMPAPTGPIVISGSATP